MSLQVEFDFTLPKGFVDETGTLHRDGVMRLATARDEIEPLRDPRIAGADDPYLTLVILGRVVVRLGTITAVTPVHIESLFAADLAFLQDLYGIINFGEPEEIEALRAATASQRASQPEAPVPNDDTEPATEAPRVRARVEEVAGGATQ